MLTCVIITVATSPSIAVERAVKTIGRVSFTKADFC